MLPFRQTQPEAGRARQPLTYSRPARGPGPAQVVRGVYFSNCFIQHQSLQFQEACHELCLPGLCIPTCAEVVGRVVLNAHVHSFTRRYAMNNYYAPDTVPGADHVPAFMVRASWEDGDS